MTARTPVAVAVILGAVAAARAQRQIAADVYLDKVHGMWMGQVLGNYGGRGDVPGTSTPREGYVVRGGGCFDIGWEDILSTSRWEADDDTSLEYMYLDLLKGQTAPGPVDIRQAWMENLAPGDVAIANRQARWLMEP
ncbi:MAG: hypothetical protein WBF17_18295, partial [Phycisphaerae bacterium]